MATLAIVVCDGEMGTTRHAQDITGGRVLARGDIATVDIDVPHEADLINTGILRILGFATSVEAITLPGDELLPGVET